MTQHLICVDRGCAPGGRPRRVLLPHVRVIASGDGAATGAAAITLVPRVPAKAARRRADVQEAARRTRPPRHGRPARLALAALVVAARRPRPRSRRRSSLRGVAGTSTGAGGASLGLDDALRLLRESAGRPAADRRRAADLAGRLAPDDPRRGDAGRLGAARPAAPDVAALAEPDRGGRPVERDRASPTSRPSPRRDAAAAGCAAGSRCSRLRSPSSPRSRRRAPRRRRPTLLPPGRTGSRSSTSRRASRGTRTRGSPRRSSACVATEGAPG